MNVYKVSLEWDNENKVWAAQNEHFNGLILTHNSFVGLTEQVKKVLSEIIPDISDCIIEFNRIPQ